MFVKPARSTVTAPADSAADRFCPSNPREPGDGMPSHVALQPLGRPSAVTHDSWRQRIREKLGLAQVYRVAVFLAGLLCITAGVALSVLPGPLTIPPVLLGLWIWSTEFDWAQRLFRRFQRKARQAWQHAKAHPVSSAAITIGGLLAVLAGVWALRHFEIIARVREAVGL